MKFIITFLFSVVAYTAGSPTCTEEGIRNCLNYDTRTQDNPFVETEENLNSFCRLVTCLVDFREICGETGPGSDMAIMFKQYNKIFNEVCDKPNQTRQKYLENAKCLNKEVKNLNEKCPVKDDIDMNDPDFCKNVEEHIDCSYDAINKECGEDARDVYTALYPGLDFFGCKK